MHRPQSPARPGPEHFKREAAADHREIDVLRHAAEDLRREATAERDPASDHREHRDKAALGAPTEGTVSRRRSGKVDPRWTHCLPCGQRPKGNRSNRARLG